ncbi:MAG: UDP-N-acetylmuramoyl-L-alanyl-D-glutamate--2,6-diaminopimelate ligase [Oscillospiraceae bacterium]|nr:UDP-N-acetylmuramoyl-L-alanyl-D-glutamate--2,6-diaminopimelate ligase [Oscillospiraceae bacterium]
MKLSQLLEGVPLSPGCAVPDIPISSVSYDTRTLEPGALFVALPGYQTDGRRYIPQALERGAAAVLCAGKALEGGPVLACPDSRAALARISANWFGHPGRDLTLLAVTGTSGKTATACLLEQMLAQCLPGPVGRLDCGGAETPESFQVQQRLRGMADAGVTHAVLEVPSQAVALHRADGLDFAAGILTNLTPEHLDFHGDEAAYRRAKESLLRSSALAVLNLDDKAGRQLAPWFPTRLTFSECRDEADLTAKNLRLFPDRVEFEAVTVGDIRRVRLPIPGGFSVYNALACLACGLGLGLPLDGMALALGRARGVPGRLERVETSAGPEVFIDRASTPNALENILLTLRPLTQNHLICLFGCQGDRDRSQRGPMGAAELADRVVLTADDPRTEPLSDIFEDVLRGMEGFSTPCQVEPNRRKAIALALSMAGPGDVVLLAWKGCRTWQEVNGVRCPLDEREEVARFYAGAKT